MDKSPESSKPEKARRLVFSAVTGVVLTVVPVEVLNLSSQSHFVELAKQVSDVVLFPGYLVALGLEMGRFHDISFTTIEVATFAVYAGLTYVLLRLRARRRNSVTVDRPPTD